MLSAAPILLVVPLLDTGNTIVEVLGLLEGQWGLEDIRVLSVLSTKGNEPRFGETSVSGGKIVDYFLRVSQEHYLASDREHPCPMCRLDLPFTHEGVERSQMLTSYDFWEMVGLVGLKDEENVPDDDRPSIGKVPDFPRMLHSNGAWLTKKIGDILEDNCHTKLNDMVLVCPDQKGAQVLTQYLEVSLGANVVKVPDDAVKLIKHAVELEGLINGWEEKRPEWYLALKTAPARKYVIMDEFTVTGGTRMALERLVWHLGKDVVAHFSFVDFMPENGSQFDVPYLALYEWSRHRDYTRCEIERAVE